MPVNTGIPLVLRMESSAMCVLEITYAICIPPTKSKGSIITGKRFDRVHDRPIPLDVSLVFMKTCADDFQATMLLPLGQ